MPDHASSLTPMLAAVLAACPDGGAVREILAKASKDAAVKQAFAPFKKDLEWGQPGRRLLQACLELPADAELHRAAAELLARGEVAGPVHVLVARTPQPRRGVVTLLASKLSPIVYAGEIKGRVSLWSTTTGEHLADLPLAKKTAMVLELAELADGSLRVLTSGLQVLLRRPGAEGFEREVAFKVEGGARRERYWSGSDDLRYHLVKPDYNAKQTPEGPRYRLHVYDVEAKKPVELTVAGYDGDFIKVGPAQVAMPTWRDEGATRVHELVVVDLPTASVRVLPLPDDPSSIHLDVAGASLLLTCVGKSGETGWARFRLADGATTMLTPGEIEGNRRFPRELVPYYDGFRDGLRFTHESEIRDTSEAVLAFHTQGPSEYYERTRRLLLRGPQPGWFIVSSGMEGGTVAVIAPYGSLPAAAPTSAGPLPEAPAWAREGTVLGYHSADYDAEDTYRYRVLSTSDGFTVQIDMTDEEDEDDEPGAPERVGILRFTEQALRAASEPVVVAQGSTDLDDVDAPISGRSPPCLLGRELFARLVAGETIEYTHPWNGEPGALQAAGEVQARMLEIDDNDRPAPVRVFAGEAGTLVVLDDASWPLVIDYETGDCHLKLTSIKLPRATAKKKARAKKG